MDETTLQKFERFFVEREKEEVSRQLIEHPTYYTLNMSRLMNLELEEYIENNPEEAVEDAKKAFEAVKPIGEEYPDDIEIYFKGFQGGALIPRELNIYHKNKLVVVKGTLCSITGIEPLCISTLYKCNDVECGEEIEIDHTLKKKTIKTCPLYGCAGKMVAEHEVIINAKIFYMQDDPSMLGGSKAAVELRGIIKGDLAKIDYLTSGDMVCVTGILKVDYKDAKSALYEKYIEITDVVKERTDVESIKLSEEDIAKIRSLARQDGIQKTLINSIAPSIYGHIKIKEGILLWLVGGVKRILKDGSKVRGDSHMMWVGDPSSAKTYFARWIENLMPKVVYTQGKGTSVVGLTASLGKDELTGKWLIQAGAAVRANGGYLIADEIDKMKKEDLDGLDEFLESQQVSITKAVHQTMKAECPCLAIANPKLGRFDQYKDLAEQVMVASPAFMSRFDLKYAIVDKAGGDDDVELVKHILEGRSGESIYKDTLDHKLLRKYLIYARREIHPEHTPEAISILSKAFISLRKQVDTIPITIRQLDGLTRLSEASAKLRLSDTVEEEDSQRAIRVLGESLESIGCVGDIDKAEGRISKSQVSKADIIRKIIEELETGAEGKAGIIDIKARAFLSGISGEDVDKLLEKMKQSAAIYSPVYGYWKVC